MRQHIGIDFGTTNSALALARPDGAVELAEYHHRNGASDTFRSLLYFERDTAAKARKVNVHAGPLGIDRYLETDHKGRLVQSVKSYLASRLFTTTNIFGRQYRLEELVSLILRDLVRGAEAQFGKLETRAVVGRPVHFAGAEKDDDEKLAVTRLQTALKDAGIEQVTFEFEPVAAAYFYESQLDHDELILIADFGGGTSDFSILKVGPSRRKAGASARAILGTDGVPIAGDVFDARIVRHLVSPQLGRGSLYRSVDKWLETPAWIYLKLERWHHLSFLRNKETLDVLKSIREESAVPERIEALMQLINEDLGFRLHRSVQQTKYELSGAEETVFRFCDSGIAIEKRVARVQFETWIAEDLAAISECVDRLMKQTGVVPAEVDKVFLTGGSSLVPAVKRIFADRFGAAKLAGGSEFTSVAKGLALRALET